MTASSALGLSLLLPSPHHLHRPLLALSPSPSSYPIARELARAVRSTLSLPLCAPPSRAHSALGPAERGHSPPSPSRRTLWLPCRPSCSCPPFFLRGVPSRSDPLATVCNTLTPAVRPPAPALPRHLDHRTPTSAVRPPARLVARTPGARSCPTGSARRSLVT